MKSSRRDFLKTLAVLGVASSQAMGMREVSGEGKDLLTIGEIKGSDRLPALQKKTGLTRIQFTFGSANSLP